MKVFVLQADSCPLIFLSLSYSCPNLSQNIHGCVCTWVCTWVGVCVRQQGGVCVGVSNGTSANVQTFQSGTRLRLSRVLCVFSLFMSLLYIKLS